MTRRPFKELAGIALKIVAFWLIYALTKVVEGKRRAMSGLPNPLEDALQFVEVLEWALLTPIVAAIAERISFRRGRILLSTLQTAVTIAATASFGRLIIETTNALALRGRADFGALIRGAVPAGGALITAALIFGVAKLIAVYRDMNRREQAVLALQAELAETEAEGLRRRTRPEFVFGALHAIREAIARDGAAAGRMIVSLSDILRWSISRQGTTATIEEELDLVDRYLELRRMQSGAALPARFAVEAEILHERVPLLVLVTLVDVVMKYEPKRIEIRGRLHQGRIRLEALSKVGEVDPFTLADQRIALRQWVGARQASDVTWDGGTLTASAEMAMQESERIAV